MSAGKVDVLAVMQRAGELLPTKRGDKWDGDLPQARDVVAEMIAALEASEREHANMDEDAPLDPGCVLCTSGTTPAHRDTGPCAHHQRVAVLAKVRP